MGKLSSMWGKRGHSNDAPDKTAANSVKLFCQSGSQSNTEDGVGHLPAIVEAAEASPKAAGAAASQIQSYLKLDYDRRAGHQYNAIMLIRILADNPGPSFTSHMGKEFTSAVKDLLRRHRDPSVQQIMRETLQSLELEKNSDTNLVPLLTMWRAEKESRGNHQSPAPHPGYIQTTSTQLPSPHELAARNEEARNSAKLLVQLSQTTSPWDFADNELLKEFLTRCQSAQVSLQGYMNCVPPPDEHTFQTLIETSEQISVAINKYQRASLGAHRQTSNSNMTTSLTPASSSSARSPPPPPIPTFAQDNQLQQRHSPPTAAMAYPQRHANVPPDPFDDSYQVSGNGYPASARGARLVSAPAPYPPNRAPLPTNGTIELPLSRTPPPTPPSHTALQSHYVELEEDLYSAGPAQRQYGHENYASELAPPPRQHVYPTPPPQDARTHYHEDQRYPAGMSTSSPHPSQLAPPRQELQATPSYYARQDVAAHDIVMSGAAMPPHPKTSLGGTGDSMPPTPGVLGERDTTGGRIKDDDPLTPMAERGGWRNWK